MDRFTKERSFLKTDFSVLKGITTGKAKGEPQPASEKELAANETIIALPLPSNISSHIKKSVYECIQDRRSQRHFSETPITLDELSYLLWATEGVEIIDDKVKRTVPSAGATYTFETYLLVQNVIGLVPGLYRYRPFENELALMKEISDISAMINDLTMAKKQPFVPYFAGKAAVTFIWTTIPYRSEWKFDIQAHKKILIDAGHVCQNLYLAGESISLGVCAIGIYNQDKLDQFLGIDGNEELTIYLAAVGNM